MDIELTRQLATAVKALAESNQGLGSVLREHVAIARETNRVLGEISDQNASMREYMERNDSRQADSERTLRVVKSSVEKHAERLVKIEEAIGLFPAAE